MNALLSMSAAEAPGDAAAPGRAAPLRAAAGSLLRSYARVIFARDEGVGALLLAATMSAPVVGLCGLAGAALTTALARALGLDRALVDEGVYGTNGLLVGLVLGAFLPAGWGLLALAPVAAALVLGVHVALGTVLERVLVLPGLSSPFVLACWLSLTAASPTQKVWRPLAGAANTPTFPGPAELERLLAALGATFALPAWTAGLLVLAALLRWSRVATLYALVGYAAARAFELAALPGPLAVDAMTLGFNVVLTAVALGCVFTVPGWGSLGAAALGAVVCALVSAGLAGPLGALGLPLLALPFNLVVLGGLVVLAARGGAPAPPLPGASPEENLAAWRLSLRRFGGRLPLRLPFQGEWVVTQGHDGAHTHQGPWRHGLDFEVAGPDGLRHEGEGARPEDWRCFGLPVLAMAAGTVVRVVDTLPDRAVGEPDTRAPWGNLVVIQHGPGLYSLMAHLQHKSVLVQPGQPVTAGQPVARCGASGRAPVPHLHVQLQGSPEPGAPTLPIAFAAVASGEALRFHHVPVEGEALRPVQADPALLAALRLPPGWRTRARTRRGDRESIELITSEIDALGRRALRAEGSGARLWFDCDERGFVVWDHLGPAEGPLHALALALPRAPLSAEPMAWEDHLNPLRLPRGPLAPLADALAPFLPDPSPRVRLRSRVEGGRLLVHGEGEGLRTELTLELATGDVNVLVNNRGVTTEVSCSSHG